MRALAAGQTAVDGEDGPHAEQREGDDQEAGDRATAHGHLDRFDETPASGGGDAHVGPDADQHADDPAGHRADGADQECAACPNAQRQTVCAGVGDVRGLDERDDCGDDHRADESKQEDRRVLALDEGDRALLDRRRDVHHRLGPGVAGQDVTGEEDRKPYREQPRDRDEPLEQTWVHGGLATPSLTARWSAAGRRASGA